MHPNSLANLKPRPPWKPGKSGNPRGRPAVGTSILEWMNVIGAEPGNQSCGLDEGVTEAQLHEIANNKQAGFKKRSAARQLLRLTEVADIADFEDFLNGKATLAELRERGVNTEVVKKAKVRRVTRDGRTEEIREIELHDRDGESFERVVDYTGGLPTPAVRSDGDAGEPIMTFAVLVATFLKAGRPIETWPPMARLWYENRVRSNLPVPGD